MRMLALVTDAFGGFGGIAKFNRDLISSICTFPKTEEVEVVPRLITEAMSKMPDKVSYISEAANSKVRFGWHLLKSVFKNAKFDIILCGHINLLLPAYLMSLRTAAPVVLVIHGREAWNPSNHWANNWLVKKIRVFLTVSEFTRNRFSSWTGVNPEHGFILPNAVDLDHFSPGQKKSSLISRYGLNGRTILMTLARLAHAYKGVDAVLDVLPGLIPDFPALTYLIGGTGPDLPRLRRKARELGLTDRVIFAGVIPEEEKVDHYRLADAFVMPSRGEGFGIVFLEAMACGIPVVAGNQDASTEALRGGELGILVDPTNMEELRFGILTALRRPHPEVPRGVEYFSMSRFQERCHNILRMLVSS